MNKQILRLALPNIVSNITVPLLGIVDLALVGRLESEVYIGAVALGGIIFNFIYWGFAFLRMSTSGFTAQAFGRRDLQSSILTLARAVLFAILSGVFLIIIQKPIELLSFMIIGGEKNVEQLASSYFFIRIWAAPASLGLYALTGWFIGMQNARFPMLISILVNILNIGFNAMFVLVFDLKSDGVAYGTVIAQYSGFFLGVFLIHLYYRRLYKYFKRKLLMQLSELKDFFMVNKDIFIRMICVIVVFTFFTSKSAGLNNRILAINTLLLQFMMFFSYLIDGFAFAAEAIVGKMIGARNINGLKRAVKLLFLWGGGIGLLFTFLYYIGGNLFLKILTNNLQLISDAQEFMVWVIFIPLISVGGFIWDGIYIGATASKQMRNTMILATWAIFFPVYFISQPFIGNHGLWLALLLFMGSRGVYQTIIARKTISKQINL